MMPYRTTQQHRSHPYYMLVQTATRTYQAPWRFLTIVLHILWIVASVLATLQEYQSAQALTPQLVGYGIGILAFFVMLRLILLIIENFSYKWSDSHVIDQCVDQLDQIGDDDDVLASIERLATQASSAVQIQTALPVLLVSVLLGVAAIADHVPDVLILILLIVTPLGAPSILTGLRRAHVAHMILVALEEWRFAQHQARHAKQLDNDVLLAELLDRVPPSKLEQRQAVSVQPSLT